MSDKHEFDRIIAVLSKAIREARRLLTRFKIAKKTKRYKTFSLIVLNDMIERCESVEAMAKSDAFTGINTVARSAFENYADLLNLLKYKEAYVDYMLWTDNNQERSFLQPIVENPTAFSKSFTRGAMRSMGQSPARMLADAEHRLDELAQELPGMYKDKYGRVQRRDMLRFELAEKVDEYNALYRHLSHSAHARFGGMLSRIMIDGEIHWPPVDRHQTRPLVAVDCLCAILLEASGKLARAFNKPLAPLNALAKEHTAVRGTDSGVIGI